MKGLLVVNKNKGFSSSSAVVKIKKLLKNKKVGHMGTLDPLASGVLLVGVGKATRLFQEFLNKKKRYLATFKFGEQTDTLDLEGKIVKTCDYIPSKEEITAVLSSFIGIQNQIPPMYSTKKIDGKRAYDLVRSGKDFELKPNKIEIFDFKLKDQIDASTFVFEIFCSSGTYIRSIARDLGEKLKTCATMVDLVRTECGNFSLTNAVNLETENEESLIKKIIPLKDVLKDYKKIDLLFSQLKDLLDGKKVVLKDIKDCKNYCLVFNQEIVGICDIDSSGAIKINTFLYD